MCQLEGYGVTGKRPFVTVFNPLARFHLHHSLPVVHKKNENEKKREEGAGDATVSFRILLKVLLTEEKNLKVRSVHG